MLHNYRRRTSLSWFLRSLACAGPFDTMCPTGSGRGNKLVTEDWKPVGSGRFRDRSQDSDWVLGTSCSTSFSLREELRLGSSSDSNDLTALTSQTDPPFSPGQHALCPGVAQPDAPFKENGWRSFIVACMCPATPADPFPRHQYASDVTRITCEAASHYTVCLLSPRCATRGHGMLLAFLQKT
jgi:hypothetical protein